MLSGCVLVILKSQTIDIGFLSITGSSEDDDEDQVGLKHKPDTIKKITPKYRPM